MLLHIIKRHSWQGFYESVHLFTPKCTLLQKSPRVTGTVIFCVYSSVWVIIRVGDNVSWLLEQISVNLIVEVGFSSLLLVVWSSLLVLVRAITLVGKLLV